MCSRRVRDTALQMWARDQRLLHHSEYDLTREYLTVALPVRELPPADQGAGPAAAEAVADDEPWLGEFDEDGDSNIPFEPGWIRVKVRNNNRVLKQPKSLQECLTFQQVADKAFPTAQEVVDAQNKIIGTLERINRALDAKEHGDGTYETWSSWAYYLERYKLLGGYADKNDLDIFDEEKSVIFRDRLVRRDTLIAYMNLFQQRV